MQNMNFDYLILYITQDSSGGRHTVLNIPSSPTVVGEAFIYAGFMRTRYNQVSKSRSRSPSYALPEGTAISFNDAQAEFEIHSIMRCGNHVSSQFQFIEYAKVLSNFSEYDYQSTKHKFFLALNEVISGNVWSTGGNTIKFDIVNYRSSPLYYRDTQKILSLHRETTGLADSKVVYPMNYFKRGHPLYHEHVALPAKAKPDSPGAAIFSMIELLSGMRLWGYPLMF